MSKKVIERVVRISTAKFTEACLEIFNEDGYDRIGYLPLLKKKLQTSFLRLPLQKIAMRYLPFHQEGLKVYFPAELIVRIANKMNVYVTDLIRVLK